MLREFGRVVRGMNPAFCGTTNEVLFPIVKFQASLPGRGSSFCFGFPANRTGGLFSVAPPAPGQGLPS